MHCHTHIKRPGSALPRRRAACPRNGLSLLEVIIATAVLSIGVAMLTRVMATAHRNATRASERVTAQLLCQNALNEILAGIEPLEPVALSPVAANPEWLYSVDMEPWETDGLRLVTVAVYRTAGPASVRDGRVPQRNRVGPEPDGPAACQLRRIVRDPKPAEPADSLFPRESARRPVEAGP